jgi:hypothetical protein
VTNSRDNRQPAHVPARPDPRPRTPPDHPLRDRLHPKPYPFSRCASLAHPGLPPRRPRDPVTPRGVPWSCREPSGRSLPRSYRTDQQPPNGPYAFGALPRALLTTGLFAWLSGSALGRERYYHQAAHVAALGEFPQLQQLTPTHYRLQVSGLFEFLPPLRACTLSIAFHHGTKSPASAFRARYI